MVLEEGGDDEKGEVNASKREKNERKKRPAVVETREIHRDVNRHPKSRVDNGLKPFYTIFGNIASSIPRQF